MFLEENYYKHDKISLKETILYLKQDNKVRMRFLDKSPNLANTIASLLSPNMMVITSYRLAHYFLGKKLSFLARILYNLSIIFFGCEILPCCEIGPGFFLGHVVGTLILAKIGKNACIYGKVTIGGRGEKICDKGWLGGPVIGDNVTIGIGATILGHFRIGDNVFIKTMSLVTDALPDNAIAGGIPAIVSKKKRTKSNNDGAEVK
ncbi:MAG: serine acetyltransferase [Candidatus Omnitrophica bacterium]|nr:serine acetyltransferase [Candidatus Omnitrophota bacterium]